MSSASRVLPLSGEPSLSHNWMMLRKLFGFWITCKGLPAMDSQLTRFLDSQLTRLHLHFASTKSSTFVRLASSQFKINVGRRGTNWAQSPPDLDWYLDVLDNHTTVDSAPGCLSRRRIAMMIYFKLWVLEINKVNPCARVIANLVSKWDPKIAIFLNAFLLSVMAFWFPQWLSSTPFCFP